ncbi:hypothetical protein [Bacillus sp. ISL-55]|uniref:hypothetical protein n=1 Tax=Bacillus sp. ISL-55 TaxID=2819134 RepID=UPI001BE76627|nr:hypothetical protein [Bacillus sp. ISL-55]MBT2694616.1 hypothetical protein [Bacillus sp. ISL-55]
MDKTINKHSEEAKNEIEEVVVGLFTHGVNIEAVKNALNSVNQKLETMHCEIYKKKLDWARRLASENYKYNHSIEFIEDVCMVDRKEFIDYINNGKKEEE